MSRIHEAIRKSERENRQATSLSVEAVKPVAVTPSAAIAPPSGLAAAGQATLRVAPAAHLVALTDPMSLGAEKFRVLATRIENLRKNGDLKSFQVTSGGSNEGKSLISANLAFTLARRSNSKVLLIEGDLHKPALTKMFGLQGAKGLGQYWSKPEAEISHSMYQINGLPLWFLPAGEAFDQPSDILQSARFGKAFAQLTTWFDWIVVDSTPLLPMADVNLWSRWVNGILLVVREGVAPVSALKKGLAGLDNAQLLGVVLNEASEYDEADYYNRRYLSPNSEAEEQVADAKPEVVA